MNELTNLIRITALVAVLKMGSLQAQNPLSVSAPAADNSVEAELASFQFDDRLEVSLFADESLGIANPVCFRWDASDRLWVLCTWAYPQVKPSEKPNDKLMILEDTDGDGKADKVSTFVDGLDMPTGFALGHGGAYIGEGRDLIHVRDTDGDGRAESREVLFTGFGTGDTHQNINSFAWSPGGELLFCQGLHCFSHVQTPWGNRRLEEHGTWRLRPLRRQLNSFRRTSGGGNPWGYAFGDWGEPFIKGNDPGVYELLPMMAQTDHIAGGYYGGASKIGATTIKSMVIEIVDSPHLPDDLQGDFLIAGYFARNIARLRPEVDGAGHKLAKLPPILASSHNAYRPVDLSIGPDGALYVADWFNPIIGHYQASFRHPDRDETHGRIWRITAKDRPLLDPPKLAEMNADQLCEQLAAPLRRTRQLAKLRLMDLPKADVIEAAQRWVADLQADDPGLEHKLFEAIGVFESHEVVNQQLLDRLLAANDYHARAYATRVVGRWHDRIDDPLARLRASASDPHPRVRLETIVAASEVPSAESIMVAAQAADDWADRFIQLALNQTIHALAEFWRPALLAGELDFAKPAHLVRVVEGYGSGDVITIVRQKLAEPAMVTVLASLGNTADAAKALDLGAGRPEVLSALTVSARERNLQPPPNAASILGTSLISESAEVRIATIELVAAWNLKAHAPAILNLAATPSEALPVRLAATRASGTLGEPGAADSLAGLADLNESPELRAAAVAGLARLDVKRAAKTVAVLAPEIDPSEIGAVLAALLQRKEGAAVLAASFGENEIPTDTAKLMRRWLNTAGRSDPELVAALNQTIGVSGILPEYNAEFVNALAKEALESGDAANGKKVFQLPLATCTSCHQVDGIEGAATAVKGPNLSAVAAGLPIELLVESVLFPARQIKEGYAATTVMTKDGGVVSGFADGENQQLLRVRDLTSGEIAIIRKADISSQGKGGSMMPPGLTASLTRQELRDLIKYLSTLKTTDQTK